MKQFLSFFLMLLTLAITSCGGDNDEPSTNTTKDPDGTVIVNISQGGEADAVGVEIRLDDSYNLRCYSWSGESSISVVGPVKSIANINATETSVRNLTWSYEAAAQVGYGYILRQHSGTDGYDEKNGREKVLYSYYAVYVDSEIASTSGGVLGYKLKVRKLLDRILWAN